MFQGKNSNEANREKTNSQGTKVAVQRFVRCAVFKRYNLFFNL